MVTSLLVSTFAVLLVAPGVAAPPAAPPPAPLAAQLAAKPVTTTATTTATTATTSKPATKPIPAPLDWRARVAITIKALQTEAPDRLARLEKMHPTRNGDDLSFGQADLREPRSAAVLLRRLLGGEDPAAVRCALVDALPQTGGDWQEGAAALIGIDAAPAVRKRLVETMRYASAPHSVHGLRLGFKDEDPEINVAAARTAGFSRNGPDLVPELYSSTFDTDWDLRAAAVQSLGMLKLPQSREVLLKALYDEEREVRLQGLLALEQLDPEGVLWLPEIDRLARDRKSHRIARKCDLMLQKRRAAQKSGKPAPVATTITTTKPPTITTTKPPTKPTTKPPTITTTKPTTKPTTGTH